MNLLTNNQINFDSIKFESNTSIVNSEVSLSIEINNAFHTPSKIRSYGNLNTSNSKMILSAQASIGNGA